MMVTLRMRMRATTRIHRLSVQPRLCTTHIVWYDQLHQNHNNDTQLRCHLYLLCLPQHHHSSHRHWTLHQLQHYWHNRHHHRIQKVIHLEHLLMASQHQLVVDVVQCLTGLIQLLVSNNYYYAVWDIFLDMLHLINANSNNNNNNYYYNYNDVYCQSVFKNNCWHIHAEGNLQYS